MVQCYMKVDVDYFKMHIVNPRATTEKFKMED